MNTPKITTKTNYDEVYRRIPTLDRILDNEIASEVRRLTAAAPDYFWTRPGSYSGHHNPNTRGLWKHTLKMSTVVDNLAPSLLNQNKITERDVDRAHAAVILHDQWKNGMNDEPETFGSHDVLMAEIVREESELDELIARACAAHMGPWGSGPEPNSNLDELVHHADMMASDDAIDIPVYEPLPSELEEIVCGTTEPREYRGDDDE